MFFQLYKIGTIDDGDDDDDDKTSDCHISLKEYLLCEKNGDKFDIKDMGDYHDHYFKKDVLL